MDHQVPVRVLHRLANLEKEPEAWLDVQALGIAEDIDRPPVDMLHHEVGGAVVGIAAVEQAGDIGMLEMRQDLPLLAQAGEKLAFRAALQHLGDEGATWRQDLFGKVERGFGQRHDP